MTEQTKAVEIIIDKEKCRYSMYDPLGCKKCMQVCPEVCFATLPSHKRDFSIPLEKRVDPTVWVLGTPWDDQCNGCGACIKVCPTQAITIKFDGIALKG
ncbi:MAG: 4Fe-4S binding protein [Chloroflexota bacterium]|nr:4Fe-4S binding protein [Chloroflexota bacterium]